MTLREKQSLFARMVADLIIFAYDNGYELTLGDAYRDPRCPYGSDRSLHHSRLAIDLNLFEDGKWIQTTEGFELLRDYWVSIGGARMVPGDANHFSLEYRGKR